MGNWERVLALLLTPTLETLIMVVASTALALVMGLPLGIALVLTGSGGLKEQPVIYRVLDGAVNIFRSMPFIILMILLFPLSRILVGTTVGTKATLVSLSIAAAPMVGRLVEGALKEVDRGVIEAAQAMGASARVIVSRVLIPEAMPALVSALTLTVINIVGYSAMAGAIGGGGLGDLAIRFGMHRFKTDVLIAAVIMILLLVQLVQWAGNLLTLWVSRHR